uniref:Ig-like domain-containing protein n=1 Tax=Terrapene triunguis TaxID=2587831 RepID=A0A674IYC4_9SAUR
MGLGGVLIPLLVLGVAEHDFLFPCAGSRLQIVTDPSSRALLGSGALLKCWFDVGGPVDLSSLRVHWYLFEERIAQYDQGRGEFQVRASVSEQELKTGDASLSLSRVTVSDEGPYKCVVGYGMEQLQGQTTLHVLGKDRRARTFPGTRSKPELVGTENGTPQPGPFWGAASQTPLSALHSTSPDSPKLKPPPAPPSLAFVPFPGQEVT